MASGISGQDADPESKPSTLASYLPTVTYPKQSITFAEARHYVFFYTCAGTICGVALGLLSSYKRHRYRKWVYKQPQAVQLKLIEKQNILASGQQAESSGLATSRYSSLPHAMDLRPQLPRSGEYRPYQWYELGPLKLWNNLSNFPVASEAFIESGKWMVRVALLTGLTLTFESAVCMYLGCPLGINPYIRGGSGFLSGWLIGNVAAEGVLYWYEAFGIAASLGVLWALATMYDPTWGETARDNQFVAELWSTTLHKRVKKYYQSREKGKQLFSKDLKERHEIYEEIVKSQSERAKSQKTTGETVEEIMLKSRSVKDSTPFWFMKAKTVEIPKEIEEMSYEQRKQAEQDAIGDSLAVNFNRYPFKGMRRERPQFFMMDKERYRNESDTHRLVQGISSEPKRKASPFNDEKRSSIKDINLVT